MSAIPFLQTIAHAYHKRYGALHDTLFVFPNKRASTFFGRYLRSELAPGEVAMPGITTISDLVATLSDCVVEPRIPLLFTLFKSFKAVLNSEGAKGASPDFESFRGWGEIVLSDFNEVDMYCVPPEAIFAGVKNYREIQSTYLTEEQRDIIEEYFGTRINYAGEASRFWTHFERPGDVKEGAGQRDKFLRLWEMLAPLYRDFRARLSSRGAAYSGMAYARALERLRNDGLAPLGFSRIVMVGFNVLTLVEWRMFGTLAKLRMPDDSPAADFVWDMPAAGSRAPMADADNSAVRFIERNIRTFPKPAWLDLSPSDSPGLPAKIELIAAPSNAAQAKLAAAAAVAACREAGPQAVADAKIAIVLPDESILLPLLYALPEGIGSVNLTMGYPLRHTSAASLFSLLRRMQLRKRRVHGQWEFFGEDVELLVSHPLVLAVAGTVEVERMRGWLAESGHFTVSAADAARLMPSAKIFFTIFSDESGPSVCDTLDAILASCLDAVRHRAASQHQESIDAAHLQEYRDAIGRLADAIAEAEIPLRPDSVFSLVERTLSAEQVSFEGEPLEGLQVMGMLETRCLDFEHLVIPSLNERILPRRMRRRTFIPAALRAGYGMAPAALQESVYAYYFYRLIARAKSLTMLYDARTSGLKSGGVSRYAMQLQHLYAANSLKHRRANFTLRAPTPMLHPLPKTEAVEENLCKFLTPGTKFNLSASALNEFASCPLRFYYKFALCLADDEEPSEYMDARTQGTVIHDAMQLLYTPLPEQQRCILPTPILLSAEQLKAMAADKEHIYQMVRRAINKNYLKRAESALDSPLSGEAELIARAMVRIVARIITHDASIAPLEIIGTEVKGRTTLPLPDGRQANATFSIDRIDRPAGAEGIRIIDYKTGTVHVDATDVPSLFIDNYACSGAFQLLLYAYMLRRAFPEFAHTHIDMALYGIVSTRAMEHPIQFSADKTLDASSDDVATQFAEQLQFMLERLFGPEPLQPAPNSTTCTHCAYREFCR